MSISLLRKNTRAALLIASRDRRATRSYFEQKAISEMTMTAKTGMFQGPTLGQRMSQFGGHTRGFDYLRFGLALLVLCWHGVKAVYGPDAERAILGGPLHAAVCLILPMFFALSGFLVCGSLQRTRAIVPFIVHRVLRIIPALAVEITLSALILGPLMTQLPLTQYFSQSEFYHYFLNIIGFIHFVLPEVFANNPEPYTINASLWTIPYELECYITLVIIASIGLLKRIRLFTALVLVSWCVFTGLLLWHGSVAEEMQSGPPGRLLVISFLAGNVIFLLRDWLRVSPVLLVASAVLSYGLLSRPETAFLAPLPVAYLTAYLGLLNPPKIPVLMDGDYSYGLYLFAFPIQQTYSAILSLGYAFMSWHLIEKPILSHRKRIVAKVEVVLGLIGSRRRDAPREQTTEVGR
jgi:peptidoglycan/LPS O-acetylase OafA/YrhL